METRDIILVHRYYTRILCTGQMAEDYNEKIAACTNRVEKMDLCCNTVVDWSLKQCQICGNSDSETFYSPLSWRNNLVSVCAFLQPIPGIIASIFYSV